MWVLSIRKYIAVAPGRKGIVMTDIELQILITLHLLTAEQKKVALLSALLSLKSNQTPPPVLAIPEAAMRVKSFAALHPLIINSRVNP